MRRAATKVRQVHFLAAIPMASASDKQASSSGLGSMHKLQGEKLTGSDARFGVRDARKNSNRADEFQSRAGGATASNVSLVACPALRVTAFDTRSRLCKYSVSNSAPLS
jgi:hypothetical protein